MWLKFILCSYNILDQLKLKSGIRVSHFFVPFKLNTKGSFLILPTHCQVNKFYFPLRIFISVLNFSHSSAPHTNVLTASKNTRTTFYGIKLASALQLTRPREFNAVASTTQRCFTPVIHNISKAAIRDEKWLENYIAIIKKYIYIYKNLKCFPFFCSFS